MEINVDDMVLGFPETINFRNMRNRALLRAPSFELMATQDNKSYVITYIWVNDDDPYHKVFNDREEAFYIDGVNEENKEKAKNIFLGVYHGLLDAYVKDYFQDFIMEPLVRKVIDEYDDSKQM